MKRECLSLFSGIGLGDLGFEVAGVDTVGQVEIDGWNRRVLEHHWPVLWRRGDITEVTDEEFRRFKGVWCVAGGFPCQDISVAGKGAGIDGERSGLWTHMRRAISVCRPEWALIENVPALRTRGADRMLADMEGLGYACWSFVVGAWAVGAPHRRNRVWIVCRRVSNANDAAAQTEQLQQRSEHKASELGGSGRLADTESRGQRADGCSCGSTGHADECGAVLSDTQRERRGARTRERGDEAGARIGRGESCGSCGVGNTMPARLEGRRICACGTREEIAGTSSDGVCNFWPTGPGQPQHPWEYPRIVESGVGGATDDRQRRRAMAGWRKSSLKGLGNAQVPLVVAAVVRAMIKIEDAGDFRNETL